LPLATAVIPTLDTHLTQNSVMYLISVDTYLTQKCVLYLISVEKY